MRALRGEYMNPARALTSFRILKCFQPVEIHTRLIHIQFLRKWRLIARENTADALLSRYMHEHGRYPRAMALVLWGLDNIKTQGEGVAQALWLLGVRPVRDALNRATESK